MFLQILQQTRRVSVNHVAALTVKRSISTQLVNRIPVQVPALYSRALGHQQFMSTAVEGQREIVEAEDYVEAPKRLPRSEWRKKQKAEKTYEIVTKESLEAAQTVLPEGVNPNLSRINVASLKVQTHPTKGYSWLRQRSLFKTAKHVIEQLNDQLVAENYFLRPDGYVIPLFRAGDAIEVQYRFSKSDKNPIVVRGLCMGRKNRSINSHFRVIAVMMQTKVEFLFPLYMPTLEKVTVLERGFINRFVKRPGKKELKMSKMYFMRELPHRKLMVTLKNTGYAVAGNKREKKGEYEKIRMKARAKRKAQAAKAKKKKYA